MRDRASGETSGARAPAARETAPAAPDLAGLQRSAGNRAVASLLGPDAPRSVQRGEDDDWLTTLNNAGNALSAGEDSALNAGSKALDVVNTPFRAASSGIGKDVDAISKGIGWLEDAEHSVAHGAADAVKDVPVLGAVAEGAANSADVATQLTGGLVDGAVGLAGGVARAAVDPVDFAKNMYNLGGKLPPATMLRAAEKGLGDVVQGKGLGAAEDDLMGGVSQSFNNIWGGIGTGNDAKHPGAAPADAGLVRQILNPIYGDVAGGKAAHGAGRAAANIGAVVFGGELAEAADAAIGTEAAAGTEAVAGTEAAAGADAAAADAAPATVRTPPVGDIDALSEGAQKVYNDALANGRSPSEAFQEAQGLDRQAAEQGLGNGSGTGPRVAEPTPGGPRVAEPAPVDPAKVPTPEGLTDEGASMFRARLQQGATPEQAEDFARAMERHADAQDIDLDDNPNQAGTVARAGYRLGGSR